MLTLQYFDSQVSCSSEDKILNAEGESVLVSIYVLMVPLLSLKTENILKHLVPFTA